MLRNIQKNLLLKTFTLTFEERLSSSGDNCQNNLLTNSKCFHSFSGVQTQTTATLVSYNFLLSSWSAAEGRSECWRTCFGVPRRLPVIRRRTDRQCVYTVGVSVAVTAVVMTTAVAWRPNEDWTLSISTLKFQISNGRQVQLLQEEWIWRFSHSFKHEWPQPCTQVFPLGENFSPLAKRKDPGYEVGVTLFTQH